MTFERKIIVGLEDVRAVTFECDACRSRITMNPDKAQDIPEQCAQCKKDWLPMPLRNGETSNSPFVTFVDGLASLRKIGPNNAGFHILLEFEEPK